MTSSAKEATPSPESDESANSEDVVKKTDVVADNIEGVSTSEAEQSEDDGGLIVVSRGRPKAVLLL